MGDTASGREPAGRAMPDDRGCSMQRRRRPTRSPTQPSPTGSGCVPWAAPLPPRSPTQPLQQGQAARRGWRRSQHAAPLPSTQTLQQGQPACRGRRRSQHAAHATPPTRSGCVPRAHAAPLPSTQPLRQGQAACCEAHPPLHSRYTQADVRLALAGLAAAGLAGPLPLSAFRFTQGPSKEASFPLSLASPPPTRSPE